VNTWEEVSQLIHHVRDLLDTLTDSSQDVCEAERGRLVQSAVSLLLPAVRHKLDIGGLLGSVVGLLNTHSKCVAGMEVVSDLTELLMVLGPSSPTLLLTLELGQMTQQVTALTTKMVVGATSALQAVEKLLNGKLQPVVPPKTAVRPASLHLFAASLEHYTLTQLTSAVTGSAQDTCLWLSHLHKQLSGGGDSLNVSSQLTCTVAAMLVIDRTLEVTQRALDVLIHIARLDKTKAPLFLPLLLYCLRRETMPETRLLLLEHIPKMAQHKFCIAPILKTIQALMSSPKLQPVAIRLMTTLWEIQDRCFPQLLKAIEQHGAEMLAPLSAILQSATGVDGGPASALALEGLYYLCEAEKFQDECVTSLWLYTRSTDPLVQGAAYQALASYSRNSFRVSHLPKQVCEDLHQQVEVMRQQLQDDSVLDIDSVFTFIPGVCFTRLLQSLPATVLDDFEGFLSSMVGKEVDDLPRGIYHSATRRYGTAGSQDKAIASIPAFLATQYEKTKQPGLRPSLAAGLLFCHDPAVEVGRDGRPRKHYLVKHGKQFLDMFKTLLNEIPIQPSEWHRMMLMPQAWASFVERLFHALIESRKAELELQVKHGHISHDQLAEKTNTAWLFARDAIVDVLKTSSRGSPSQQANVVLSLAGLIVSTSRMAASLDPEVLKECDTATEHVSHLHWLNVAMDTILSLRDVKYQPRGKLLGLCQQRSAEDRTAASMLTQCTACLSLASVIPTLITSDTDLIFLIMRELTQSLPGGAKADESSALAFHTGLGLGMVVGCLLGMGMALTGLCSEGKTESRAHVSAMSDRLTTLLEQISADHSSYQALCVCLASVSGTAFGANILPIERVNATLHLLETAHRQHPQVTGPSLALGMLCYSLSKMGHPGVAALRQTLTAQWLQTVATDSAPREKVAALNGVMALIGSEQTLIVVQAGVSLTSSDVKVSEVIQAVTRIVQGDPDLGIQCNAAWMLGHMYLSASAVAENRASVPPNYDYLAESSSLRAIVDLLLDTGKQGPEFVSQRVVKVALTALQDDVRHPLPPLNWAGVLTPLTRMHFGLECQQLCLSLAMSQSASSPTAAMFLSSWLTPPLVLSLDDGSKRALYESLPKLIKSVPLSVLSTFLERSCSHTLSAEGYSPNMAVAVLQGLTASLKVPDPPEAVAAVLFQTAGRMYSLLPSEFQPLLYGNMAECLANVPDDIFDSITADDYTTGVCSLKGFYVGCYLVAAGSQPITLLNGLIDSTMNNPQGDEDTLLYVLAHCLWMLVENRTETSGPMARLNWIVELLGHTRNIAAGAVPLSSPTQTLGKAVGFSVTVVAMALSLLTSTRPTPDLGMDPELLKVKDSKAVEVKGDGQAAVPSWSGELRETLLKQLPVSVLRFQQCPWDQVLPKVFDWLMTMSRLPDDVLPSCYTQACTGNPLTSSCTTRGSVVQHRQSPVG
ncbi:hypothetical protein BaRGS_00028769, partial [Batillaria attramentaria]